MWTCFLNDAKPSKTTYTAPKITSTPIPTTSPANTAVNEEKACYKKNVGEDQNQYVRIADRISNHDLNFLALLDAENALWTIDRKSTIVGANGYRDIGYCQINPGWHPEITNDPRFLTDPEWQLQKCYELYKGGTKFYGKKNIHKTINHFICQ